MVSIHFIIEILPCHLPIIVKQDSFIAKHTLLNHSFYISCKCISFELLTQLIYSLCYSRAILGYLVDKYAKDDSLYPKDALKRAVVNQRLHFDLGTLWQRYNDYYVSELHFSGPN